MFAALTVDGTTVNSLDEDSSIKLIFDADTEFRCSACGADLVETPHGFDEYPTASAEGVLLADDTVIPVDARTAPDLWGEICDEVADLAAVDGAIGEDVTHGHLVRLDPAPGPGDDPSRA
ncbi:hypothetical protein [Parafrankia sp. BMG5.11]|uniref:hypothetical protein n=1 Tax=Parafrankia sp. BMG5.11 TaxID=222540 RepID=UPI0010408CF9|nr:hypothetical protein [Parafrankia sp. BMG5.11]TCJ34670.1 hypothetical protein E0504_32270 [Parafrankia sp. BMG5.11]